MKVSPSSSQSLLSTKYGPFNRSSVVLFGQQEPSPVPNSNSEESGFVRGIRKVTEILTAIFIAPVCWVIEKVVTGCLRGVAKLFELLAGKNENPPSEHAAPPSSSTTGSSDSETIPSSSTSDRAEGRKDSNPSKSQGRTEDTEANLSDSKPLAPPKGKDGQMVMHTTYKLSEPVETVSVLDNAGTERKVQVYKSITSNVQPEAHATCLDPTYELTHKGNRLGSIRLRIRKPNLRIESLKLDQQSADSSFSGQSLAIKKELITIALKEAQLHEAEAVYITAGSKKEAESIEHEFGFRCFSQEGNYQFSLVKDLRLKH